MVTIGPRDKGMFVRTLRNAGRGAGDRDLFRQIPEAARSRNAGPRRKLIAQKTTKFDPKDYPDRYEAALMAMIKEKLMGSSRVIAADPQRGNVVNLMDALPASLWPADCRAKSRRAAPGN